MQSQLNSKLVPAEPGLWELKSIKPGVNKWIQLNNECMPHYSDDKLGMNPTNKKILIGLLLGLFNIIMFRILNTMYKRVRLIDNSETKKECNKCNKKYMIEFTSLMDGFVISLISIVAYSKFQQILPENALIIALILALCIGYMDLTKKFRIFD